MKADVTIDCRGLFCPMPIVSAKRAITSMKSGEVLEITADDPGFEKDLPAWCRATGEKCLKMEKEGGVLRGYVQKQ